MVWILVAAGGAVGAVARHALGGWVSGWAGYGYPWGTLTINVFGSFGLALALRALEAMAATQEARALVTVGFFGAFTTFSTFSYEAVLLAQRGAWLAAAGYLAASVALGVLGVWMGLEVGAVLLRPGR